MNKNILEVKGLSKRMKGFALENISLVLPEGYIMGYVGQNGAGKTTTLKCITTHYKYQEGEISIDGHTMKEDPVAYKASLGYVADKIYFPLEFKLKMVEDTMADFYPTFSREKFRQYASRWQLPQDKKVKTFSRGMQVKLMFATVLSRESKILILDEATSGLDPVARQDILDILQDYISDGKHSVLFSSHIMEDLEQIADYVFFIDAGKEVLQGTKDALIERFIMVKGGKEDLTHALKEKLIGYRLSGVNFEGLIESKYRKSLPSNLLTEKSTIDQIVVYHIKKEKEVAL